MTPPANTTQPHSKRNLRIAGAVLLFLILLAIGIVPRVLRSEDAERVVEASPVLLPEVTVVHPHLGSPVTHVTLPGNLQPLYTASVYARTNGYVAKRFVDIGSHVRAGQLLALISTPEVDQELNQARADEQEAAAAVEQAAAAAQQAQANFDIARITRNRYAPLISRHDVTQQSLDEANETLAARTADLAAAHANVDAAKATLQSRRANVQRLEQLQGFERITAPFDGVITARNVEQGDLVNDGSSNGAQSLFTIEQGDVLRVQVEVPQSDALFIKTGDEVSLTVQERPGKSYVAKVTRAADAVDVAARTMLTEIQVDNKDGSLLPGMYGEINFAIETNRPTVVIPAVALVIDKNGMHVVTVSSDDHVHFVPVNIGQDLGSQVEISQGLTGNETLVSNPSDLLNNGEKVLVAR